jgi:adenine phosphoribosyltransferase
MDKFEELKFRMNVMRQLKIAKKIYTYTELAKIIGLPETVLSRYVKGHVMPTIQRAEGMNKILTRILDLSQTLPSFMSWEDDSLNTSRLRENTEILDRMVLEAISAYQGRLITRVMTMSGPESHFASILAHHLEVPLVHATDKEEVAIKAYRQYLANYGGEAAYLYVPKESLKRNDSVLIAQLVISDGKIEKCIVDMVKDQARADVTGVVAGIGVGNEYKNELSVFSDILTKVLYSSPLKR